MMKTAKKGLSVLLVFVFMLAMAIPAIAQDGQAWASESVSEDTVSSCAIAPQAGEYLTVTNLTIASDAADPTGIIEVRINNTGSGRYGINWSYQTGSGRVVDPPEVYDKGNGSGYRWFKLKITAVQAGTTTIPIQAYYDTADNIIATANCTVTVTAPTLTVTPSDIVIDLNNSNSATVNAVISNYTSTNLEIGYSVSSSNISAAYGNYITNGTEIIITGNTPGTYYLYTYIRNPYSGYNIVSQSHRVTVKAVREVSSISIDSYPNKTTYYVGESFSSSGMVLRVNYNDGTSEYITSGFSYTTPDMSTAGRKNIRVTYGGKTTSFNITVNAKPEVTLSSITIRTNPSKTVYYVGETFNKSGLSITAKYSDGSSKVLTSGFTCSEPDMSTAGTKTVTVTYGGKSATFSITVNVKPSSTVTLSSISIKSLPAKVTYNIGETFNKSGLSITAVYSDGSSKVLTSGFTCSAPDMSTAGTKTVTVTYGGKSAAFAITVNEAIKATSVEIVVDKEFEDTNTAELSHVVTPANASYKSVEWYSDNTSIVTVDSDGTLTTYDVVGSAVVTVIVTNYDGTTVSDTINVNVHPAEPEEEPSFFEKILDFFRMIFEFLLMPFTLIFG